MALTASALELDSDLDGGQGLCGVRVGDVLEPGAMTAFALDVPIPRIRRGRPPDVLRDDQISVRPNRVAPLTRLRGRSAFLEVIPRVGVRGLLPLGVLSDVTVAAHRASVPDIAVSEKPLGRRRWIVEERALDENALGIDAGEDGEAKNRECDHHDRKGPTVAALQTNGTSYGG